MRHSNPSGSYDIAQLAESLEGDLHADLLRRYMLSTDGSIYRKEPACVVYPRNARDVARAIEFARKNGLSVHARGSGSGLCGSALGSGIVVDFTQYMNRLLRLDLEEGWFECEPGYRFGELEAELKNSGWFFPPDPSSGEYASFGGMYGTNASGAHSVKYGNVGDYILDADVELADGSEISLADIEATPPADLPGELATIAELYRNNRQLIETSYPAIKCNVAGYNLRGLFVDDKLNLRQLFAGAEGTLGVVTRLRFRLEKKPDFDSMVVAYFDTITDSARAVQQVMPMGPSGIEIMDKSLLNLAKENDPKLKDAIPDDVDNVLLIEFDAFEESEARSNAESAKAIIESKGLSKRAHLAASEEEKARFWAVRKAAVPILYKLKGDKKILALVEDAAIPIDGLVDYFDGIYSILNSYQLRFVVYGHIAKGLMHTRPLLNLKDENDLALLKPIADAVYDLVTDLNGTVSGEHGDGRIRTAYVKRRYPGIYPLFESIKSTLDPQSIFNPEIITNPDEELIHHHLRFGKQYHTGDLEDKQLIWNEGFTEQVETCHGCSRCTTVTTATRMCPIFKFTRDESASPKAKANVLRALTSGAVPSQTLFEKRFEEVINHCVNCGSCYLECPSNVNIPKMALEAKAQAIGKYGPSLHDRAVTSIEMAARLSGPFAKLTQPILENPFTKKMIEASVGVSARRDAVLFARRPLRKRIAPIEGRGSVHVLYFAGCYASYIRPEIGEAAVRVLSHAGLTVHTPEQHCCGLPMLSKGLVNQARGKVKRNLGQWSDLLESVNHIVVTCSSCGLSLLQEWSYLLDDPQIRRVAGKLIHITDLLRQLTPGFSFNEKPVSIGYHMPCHLKLQKQSDASVSYLRRIPGVKVDELDSHCCGIAGSWGLARDHFDLSRRIGNDLTDKLDRSGAEMAATDCPTCRMQLEQFSDKPVLHPIEIIMERMHFGP